MINELIKVNYDKLGVATGYIQHSHAWLDRLSLAEEKGRSIGGPRNVEASIVAGGYESTSRQALDEIQSELIVEIAKAQEKLLKNYAKYVNIWIEQDDIRRWEPVSTDGSESRVYMDPLPGHLLKVVFNYRTFSATILEFLDNRISLHNHVFPDTSYQLVGFTEVTDLYNFTVKHVVPVLRQPFIVGERVDMALTSSEDRFNVIIDKEMLRLGFEKINKSLYVNKDYIVEDIHVGNVILTPNGHIAFIDPAISLNTPADGYGGVREYGSGKIVTDDPQLLDIFNGIFERIN